MQGTISVIIPIHNVEVYLQRCLESIIMNSYRNLEIICVNDGSTDKSLEILKAFQKRDNRIIIIDQLCKGVASARNAGLRKASGDFISFIDSDDWIHVKYFEYLHKALTDYTADISVCDYLLANEDSIFPETITYKSHPLSTEQVFASNKRFYVWRKLFKKEVLANILFDESEKIEDVLFNADIIINNNSLKYAAVDIPLYAYFQREGSLISYNKYVDRILVSQKLIERSANEVRSMERTAIIEDAIKRVLAARFYCQILSETAHIQLANLTLKKAIRYLHKNKLKYFLLYKFSIIYSFVRFKQDPSLLVWKKQLRKEQE